MGAEELGSVYESLLELVPDLQGLSQPHSRLAFVGDDDDASNKGNTRKLTGSYYTPDSLVQELIKSALEPGHRTRRSKANPSDPVGGPAALTICDPACGSGHFLLAAARRLADEVALQAARRTRGRRPHARRLPPRPARRGKPLHLRGGQEPHGHSVGQNGPVARGLHARPAADLH
jgi:hypothetical protein